MRGVGSTPLYHRSNVAPPTLSFTGQTNWTRPAFTVLRDRPFVDKAGLDSAIAGMTGGDYIHYTGAGNYPISNASGNAYILANKNPSSLVVIDFGTKATTQTTAWGAPTSTTDYVTFKYTGTGNVEAFYAHDLSNIWIYGGEYNTGNYGGASFRYRGAGSNFRLWDAYSSMSGSHGFQIQPADPSTGASRTITNCNFRVESNRFCMNPATDPHTDKGTGYHGCLWQDTNHGIITNSQIALYAHDSLRPGESSAGVTWPEGGGGSALEMGSVGDSTSSNHFFILGEHLKMIPDGSNPGNPNHTKQTGGNVVNMWGSIPLNGYVFDWVEGNDTTGAVIHCAGGSYFPGSPPITVNHGRHTNTNQSTQGSNTSTPYDTTHGISYGPDGQG